MSRPGAQRQRNTPTRLRALARAVSWHRRKLAVLAAVAAVLLGVDAALPPDPPTAAVVRVTRPLDGGATLSAADLALVRVPLPLVPEGALPDVGVAVGRVLAAPVAQGQLLTGLDVASAARSVRPGMVVAPLRLADADLVALLHVGDPVDVVAADGDTRRAAVVAHDVRVVALPRPPDTSGLAGSADSSDGALVLVEVDSRTATALAGAAVTGTLSVVLR